jgi:hypothetical protein
VRCTLEELGTSTLTVARDVLRSLFGFLTPSSGGGGGGGGGGSRGASGSSPTPAITRDDGLTTLVIKSLEHFEYDSSVQCFATANLFYLTARSAVDGQTPRARLQALRALLRLLSRLVSNSESGYHDVTHQDLQVCFARSNGVAGARGPRCIVCLCLYVLTLVDRSHCLDSARRLVANHFQPRVFTDPLCLCCPSVVVVRRW